MASKTFASLFGLGDDVFSNHNRPCVDTLAEFAAVTAATSHKAEVLGYPVAFPILCALISDADPTSILLGSSPTLYRGIAGIASNANNRVVMFLGNLEEGVVPFVVTEANSRMSFERFWTQVVLPLHTTDPVGNKPIVDFWKAATTVNGPDHNMSIATPQPPVTDLTFWGWARRTATTILSYVPSVNAPGLIQVVAAVSQVADQLQATEQTRVAEANARANIVGQSDLSIQSQSHIEPHSRERSSACTDSATSTEALVD